MPTYKTPGVYVEEISTLPPSVAGVATAIPAFFGYTEKGTDKVATVKRINTMLEYNQHFGGAPVSAYTIETQQDPNITLEPKDPKTDVQVIKKITREAEKGFLLYYAVSHYFKNGGGSCYIISVGNYDSTIAPEDFDRGMAALEKEDEPTLIVLTDGVKLPPADYYTLCQSALALCQKLGDRFSILDVLAGDTDAKSFREKIGTKDLKYGAAYYPNLQTTLNYHYDASKCKIMPEQSLVGPPDTEEVEEPATVWSKDFGEDGIVVTFTGDAEVAPQVQITLGDENTDEAFTVEEEELKIENVKGKTGAMIVAAWTPQADKGGFSIEINGTGAGEVAGTGSSKVALVEATPIEVVTSEAAANETLASIESTKTALYNQIKSELASERVVLPPSAAMAGIYATIDRERGVWKAPANVSVSAVIGPTVKITHGAQENLNVDPQAGKSINAIRSFAGKGTLVWGARTLAGNDNEWRYINVRRLFNMIEESTRKATSFAVFEGNDATTWLKVKGMIEGFLYGLWEQGALAGPTPDSAYFVQVGLGNTMTQQDVLEGRMIVEIGVAAVRPAEFIILKFMHKLQEA